MLKVRPYSSKGKPIFFSEGGLASRIYNYIVLYIYIIDPRTRQRALFAGAPANLLVKWKGPSHDAARSTVLKSMEMRQKGELLAGT